MWRPTSALSLRAHFTPTNDLRLAHSLLGDHTKVPAIVSAPEPPQTRADLALEIAQGLTGVVCVCFARALAPARLLATGGELALELERHARQRVPLPQVSHNVPPLCSQDAVPHLRQLRRLVVVGDGVQLFELPTHAPTELFQRRRQCAAWGKLRGAC